MNLGIYARACTAAVILSGLSLPAKADLTVCNRTADPLTVAVAYVNPSGGFISEGWWTLPACGGCKFVLSSSETTDPHNVFVHAHGGGLRWEGTSHFCTAKKAFTIVGNRNCEARGFKETSFMHVTSESGSHTTNLRGRTSSGVCID